MNLREILNKYDYVVGHLETFLTGNEGENPLIRPMTTTPETLKFLEQINVNLLSLASNHAYDYLVDGFQYTINVLDKKNIAYIGAGFSQKETEAEKIHQK